MNLSRANRDRSPMLGEHAVVLGASMSGLLAARVLADSFRAVTIIERDVFSGVAENRRGVPQGRHPHALLARGARTLEELFPGILDELVAAGAPVLDDADYSRVHLCVGGHPTPATGKGTPYPRSEAMYQPSRPLLEHHVRRRLRTLDTVTLLDGREVTELTATPDHKRITGIRYADCGTGATGELAADLVVDATGRGARTPALLGSLGHRRPDEDRIVVRTTYSSIPMRIEPGVLKEILVLVGPAPGRPTGMFLVRNEHDNWVFTAFGMVGHEPPRDLPAMLSFVEDLVPGHVVAALRAARPLGPAVQHRLPSSQWRRYDKVRSFPDGLLVTGDAVCSFNPIYGQGMSVAAIDTLALRDALDRGLTGLSRRYFRSTAKSIGVAWGLAAGSDLAFPDVEGRRSAATRLTNRFADWVLSACETDVVVHGQFQRVAGLIDPPTRLVHPAFLRRVASANRHRRPPTVAGANTSDVAGPVSAVDGG